MKGIELVFTSKHCSKLIVKAQWDKNIAKGLTTFCKKKKKKHKTKQKKLLRTNQKCDSWLYVSFMNTMQQKLSFYALWYRIICQLILIAIISCWRSHVCRIQTSTAND